MATIILTTFLFPEKVPQNLNGIILIMKDSVQIDKIDEVNGANFSTEEFYI